MGPQGHGDSKGRGHTHLKVGSVVLGHKGTVTLAQDCDFLLNVFDFVLCFLKVDYFNSHDFLSPIVNAFEHFSKGTFPNLFQLGEQFLWVRL